MCNLGATVCNHMQLKCNCNLAKLVFLRHDKYDYKTLTGFVIILCAKGDSPLKPLPPTDAGTGQDLAGS